MSSTRRRPGPEVLIVVIGLLLVVAVGVGVWNVIDTREPVPAVQLQR